MNRKATERLSITAVALAGLLLAGCEKWRLDAQVKELCAKDGGIKVYETVKLPAAKFDTYGSVRIPSKQDAKPSDEYYYEWNIDYYKRGNPELSRGHFKVIRRSDGRLLGESTYYGRGGGDMPGPWHDSSFRCPADADISVLKKSIFMHSVKENAQ